MNRPNVLILLSDQQRYDTVGAAGYSHMITPNLDRIAREGALFCNAHSANPVCMPARHDLITGFPARVHGYYGNAESQRIRDYRTPTIARIFSDYGYRTVAVGKMHFSPCKEHHGFDEMISMEELPVIRQQDEYLMYLKEEGLGHIQNPHGVRPHIYHIPQTAQQDEAHHGTAWVANKAIQWLSENEDNPFFMMCGFIQPHPPWNIPNECKGWYDEKQIPSPIPVSRLPFEDEGRAEWFGDLDSKEQKEKIRKAYYTAVSMVDKQVGRILDYLKESGQLDNTLIIYTSDHGEMLQDKGYYSKELPYDSAVRVPMIVRYPEKFTPGERREEFVDLLDVLPTCLDVCGMDYPDPNVELYGKSLVQKENRDYQFAATGTMPLRWVMCRNKQYKYIYHYLGGYEELYDMSKPEVENLLTSTMEKSLRTIYEDLRARTISYEERWGIEGGVVNGEFIKQEAQTIHPSVRGKFHFWSNSQMQKYYEANIYDRGEELEKEMKYALSDQNFSGVELTDVFNQVEWKDQFQECFCQYTGNDWFNDFPFDKKERSERNE